MTATGKTLVLLLLAGLAYGSALGATEYLAAGWPAPGWANAILQYLPGVSAFVVWGWLQYLLAALLPALLLALLGRYALRFSAAGVAAAVFTAVVLAELLIGLPRYLQYAPTAADLFSLLAACVFAMLVTVLAHLVRRPPAG